MNFFVNKCCLRAKSIYRHQFNVFCGHIKQPTREATLQLHDMVRKLQIDKKLKECNIFPGAGVAAGQNTYVFIIALKIEVS